MANALYTKYKEKLLTGYVNLQVDTVHAYLVDTGTYTLTIATDEFFPDITPSAVIANVVMTSLTITDGVFDGADVTFSSVSGATVELLVIAQNKGTSANDALIAAIDTATGLPVTPNGGDITVTWDTGTNKIFKLT